MDKDVKRALLLWPTIASTALVAATSLPMLWNSEFRLTKSLPNGSSAITRVVSMTHDLLGYASHVQKASLQPAVVSSDEIATSPLFGTLRDAFPEHRPDCGRRGLAMPVRFATTSTGGADSGRSRGTDRDEIGRSLDAENLGLSNPVFSQTLLAPVLDPVAELAGYSGPQATPTVSPVVPIVLATGVDHPIAATADASFTADTNLEATTKWMKHLKPVTSWATAVSDSRYTTAAHRVGPVAPEVTDLVTRPVVQHARPESDSSHESRHGRASNSNVANALTARDDNSATWPHPNQLRQDLATISSDADRLSIRAGDASNSVLTSLSKPTARETLKTYGTAEIIREPIDEATHRDTDLLADESSRRRATTLAMGRWANEVERSLDELRSLPRIGDERSGEKIRDLVALSETGLQLAERVPARDQQVRWLRASHALSRRAAVWGPIWQLARASGDDEKSPTSEVATSVPGADAITESTLYTLAGFQNEVFTKQASNSGEHVAKLTANLRRDLHDTGDPSGWTDFLLLDDIVDAAAHDDAEQRALLAQRFLSRLNHYSLKAEHRQWLKRDSIDALAAALQSWTARPVNYVQLLSELERGETDSIDLAAIKVSEAFQTMRFSEDPRAARVAKAIDVTYRNANLRTAISVELLNRFLPAQPVRTEPIRTTVLGTAVRGVSTVKSDLSLQLEPSLDSWRILLGTRGDVETLSQGGQSGVTVVSSGHNTFHANTPLIIRPHGYQVGQTHVNVAGGQRLRGIHSPYEGWPLIGSLVHGIAESQFQNTLPDAKRISNDRIRSQVTSELQSQVSEKTHRAGTQLDELVLGPLARLDLDPKVIDLETTSRRLVARYRLAGDWQLASHTPRPRAWSDSWMSLQIHQSALNNTLERLLPTGEAKSIQDFFAGTMELFGQEAKPLPQDVPTDAMIEFASTRPVTVEIGEGKVWLTLRVVRLSEPEGAALTRFIVRAGYRPEVSGLDAHLVRDGHLSISGPGMTMGQRIAVRALFNKILSEQRPIPITGPRIIGHPAMQGLAISQLELRDGWLAVAVSRESSPRVAALEATKVNR